MVNVVHKPNPHDSGPLHVTGAATYTDDIAAPAGALHLAFGISHVARGRIVSMDLSAVRAAEGVALVLGPEELGDIPDVSPSPMPEPLLSTGEVLFHGQPLFIVAAESHLLARKAARLAKVEIEESPALLTIEDALAADSLLEQPLMWGQGDPDGALEKGAHRLQGSIQIGGQEHFYLEGHAAMAVPGDGDEVTIHSSTQHPSEIQHKVAHALHVPFAEVAVQVRRMGGGFGGKESQGNALAISCALVAKRTGRAAKMRYDRDDDMVITGKRHEARIDYDVSFDAAGRIAGLAFDQYIRCGWSADLSLPVADRAMLHADNAYHLPDVRIRSTRLLTHTASNTAFRGFGGPQGMVGIERVMEHIAARLGSDPLSVRQANFYAPGKAGQTTPYGMEVEDNIAPDLVAELVRRSDYQARRAEIEAANAQSPILKRGIAVTPVKFGISFTLTQLNQAGALVHVYTDGSIRVNHGGTEMGQGLFTKVAAVAADVFGQTLDRVKITATDTSKVPNTSATAASSGSDLNGMAVKAACETIRDRLAALAAKELGRSDVRFENGRVIAGDRDMSWEDLIALAYATRISLSATGYYATPKIAWDRVAGKGRPFFYFAYGAAVTEVVIDTLTGENRILRTDILHDCGKSLNPALDIGQIEGGYVQGAGWLTTEELVWRGDGALWTHAPSTYKIPACADRPKVFNVDLWQGENREETIHRSKAVGEPPLMLGISALAALQHAVREAGSDVMLDAPATAERVLNAVETAKGRGW
ncbi:xanthine dehydrogenase molybdopterin binding subunit [Pontivivens insulae]|uniref:Xanthine dehydrogenase molybdenum-binding subunit XdhA n=1 Tax=Pontivivens insulae TaxID=1639689 RepID=A0A2R8AD14_9RHOB|nr:xanthine dehydrogenase molybdopterin binding subunit [Pontivivens insulae]RED14057.1 xanthine dehydrogenase molybdenum binding subunit apoprotein [Pontivivens insulae]SPF30131.1 Putative xanthine dehydrogenase molybdenum-binding subunit XdhA [Pontivivens insulae]